MYLLHTILALHFYIPLTVFLCCLCAILKGLGTRCRASRNSIVNCQATGAFLSLRVLPLFNFLGKCLYVSCTNSPEVLQILVSSGPKREPCPSLLILLDLSLAASNVSQPTLTSSYFAISGSSGAETCCDTGVEIRTGGVGANGGATEVGTAFLDGSCKFFEAAPGFGGREGCKGEVGPANVGPANVGKGAA